jgi:hypothetical protein
MSSRPRFEAPWIRYASPIMMALSLIAAVIIGSWFHYALAVGFAYFAAASYRAHVRAQEDRQAAVGRAQDITYWRTKLDAEGVNERKAAVELLTYWGENVTVDPLEEPAARRPQERPRRRAGLDPAEVQAKAHLIVESGRDLEGVIRLRESHEQVPQPNSALWIAACRLLEEAAAEKAGYEQDVEEIAVRSVGGGVSAVYREPVGPSPRQQLLAELDRQARKVKAEALARSPRDLPRSYLMSQKIHDRR